MGQCHSQRAEDFSSPLSERVMELLLLLAIGVVFLWLVAIAVFSSKPQASLARGVLASAGVVAGAWGTTASASMAQLGDASLLVSLLRVLG